MNLIIERNCLHGKAVYPISVIHGGGAHSAAGYQHLAYDLSKKHNVSVYLLDLCGHSSGGGLVVIAYAELVDTKIKNQYIAEIVKTENHLSILLVADELIYKLIKL